MSKAVMPTMGDTYNGNSLDLEVTGDKEHPMVLTIYAAGGESIPFNLTADQINALQVQLRRWELRHR